MLMHAGGCHCGAVRFEVEAPAELEVEDCNCSICSKSGYLHLIVPRERFRLLQGEDALTTYVRGRQEDELDSASAFGRHIEAMAGVEYSADGIWAYRFQVAQPFVNDFDGTSESANVSLLLRFRF